MPHLPLRPLTLIAATGAIALAGCGSNKDDGTTSAPAPGGTTPAAAAPAASASKGVAITMKNIAFDPKTVTVKAGTKIVWTNGEGVQHNVVADSGADFKSDLLSQGQSFTYVASKPGTIKYECTIHPGMNGTITVQ